MKTLILSAVLALASLAAITPTAKADTPTSAAQTLQTLRADLAAKDAYIVKLEAYADNLELRLSAVEAKLAAVQAPAPQTAAGLDLRLMPSVQRAYAAEAAARAAPAQPLPAQIQIYDKSMRLIGTGTGPSAAGPAQIIMR